MSTDLSSWSIRNPTPAILLFILLTLAGIWGFARMPVQNFPDMDLPVVTITASLPGAGPAQLETDVARKLEDALAGVQGVRHTSTTLRAGTALVSVVFQIEKPPQQALDEVRDAVARVRADLPAGMLDPVVRKADFASGPILTYSVSAPAMDDEALSWFVDSELTRTLLAVPGVGAVNRVGGVTRTVRVELDAARLLALNTTAADISRQLRQVQQESAGGRVALGGTEQLVRSVATVQSAAALGALELVLGDGRAIRLDQVATVVDGVAEPRAAALFDGRPVVGFEVTRTRGAGELAVADGVRAALARLQLARPGIALVETINTVDEVQENYDGSLHLLYEGAALAVLVVFLFLRDWRATLVAAVALPLSAIPTFAVMHLMGFSLNIITLLSLSLVAGILVDDAIVEIENIARHLRLGKTPRQAALEAVDEIGLAVIATTGTLIAVFLPTAFMGGVVGKFFVQFGWTAAIAVFFSLLVARLLTPMMSAALLRAPAAAAREPAWITRYLGWTRWCLRHRAWTLGLTLALFVLGLLVATRLPAGFIPPDDTAQATVRLTLAPGSTLQDTLAGAERARGLIAKVAGVRMVYTTVGAAAPGEGPGDAPELADVRTAILTVGLTPRSARPGVTRQHIEQRMRTVLAVLPGMRVRIGKDESAGNYVLQLSGQDGAALARFAAVVERQVRAMPGAGTVASSASLLQPELVVRPDFARAANLGVTAAAIADTLRVATMGDDDQDLARLNFDARQVPVVVRLADVARDDLATLRRLPVPGARGPVALENVAALEMGSGPSSITRYDRARNVTLEVEANGRAVGDVEQAVLALPALRQLPAGISVGASGDAEQLAELASGFGLAMATGVLCIYVVLVLLLNDFVQPVTILSALVLSVPGALVALYVTGAALSMPSMIGLVMLMGVATKNAILLVDYAILARARDGLRQADAVVDACRKRVRPIVMTTIAMCAGMLPVALGWGSDPSFRAPMAIVVIGGLVSSTFLSLLVVPVVFTCVDDLVAWLRRWSGAGIRHDRAAGA